MKILDIVILLHFVALPLCNGNTMDLSCLICYSSPKKPDKMCSEGLGTLTECSEHYYAHKKIAKKRKHFRCANRIVQNASVYGFYQTRTCVTDKDSEIFCINKSPEDLLYKHCSTCPTEGCNSSPTQTFTILTATCAIIALITFSI